jgi:hypothetical protein
MRVLALLSASLLWATLTLSLPPAASAEGDLAGLHRRYHQTQ